MFKILKKIFGIITLISVILCGNVVTGGCSTQEKDGFSIVTTIFPQYDWVEEIIGEHEEKFNFTLLQDTGVDLHSYQPTADDIVTIGKCDLFIYVGGHSDEWVSDVLEQAVNKDMIVINLMEVLNESDKLLVSGLEHDHEHNHDYDEHVWLSLINAKLLCENISQKICDIDPTNKETYIANANAYCEKLNDLNSEYQEVVNNAPIKTLLFGDRFSFKYTLNDYSIDYYAAFSGCSAESEASFETITYLAGKIDELGLNAVIKTESSDGELAKAIINASENKDAKILTMNSMQSVTASAVAEGADYLTIMESNLSVLRQALGEEE